MQRKIFGVFFSLIVATAFAEDSKPFVFPKRPPSPPPIQPTPPPASTTTAVNIITLSGERYEAAVVSGHNPEFIDVTHSAGVARIYFANLSKDDQARFGFNAARLAVYKKSREAQRKRDEAAAIKNEGVRREREAQRSTTRTRKLAALRRWASTNFLVATKEDQLRAALTAKYFQQRNNRRLTATEFQFLDDQSKCSIILYSPEMLPAELLDP